jgi:hypothetical protein
MEKNFTIPGAKMPINDYSEKVIRNKIINKIKPEIKKGRSKHQKGYIYMEGKCIAKVKIPNDHDRIMRQRKSQYISTALRLDDDQFNSLIDCPITGPKYYELLAESINKK